MNKARDECYLILMGFRINDSFHVHSQDGNGRRRQCHLYERKREYFPSVQIKITKAKQNESRMSLRC